MANERDNFFPIPTGEVYVTDPNGLTCVETDMTSRSNAIDAPYVGGGSANHIGAFGNWREAPAFKDQSNIPITGTTPRKRDYGPY